MAGSIPPLVSSSPPPLCAFDDEEEEDEDEFGGFADAEEIDYNGCISYKEKVVDEQINKKSQLGEQDTTSQDSATDSGLCPDSEGLSPSPNSDDERTIKPEGSPGSSKVTSNCDSVVQLGLPNGHSDTEDILVSAEPNGFGSFSFVPAPSESLSVLNLELASTIEESSSRQLNHLESHKLYSDPGVSVLPNHEQSKDEPESSFPDSEFEDFGRFEAGSVEETSNNEEKAPVIENESSSKLSEHDDFRSFKTTSTTIVDNKLLKDKPAVITTIPILKSSLESDLEKDAKDFCPLKIGQEEVIKSRPELQTEFSKSNLETNSESNEEFPIEFPSVSNDKIENQTQKDCSVIYLETHSKNKESKDNIVSDSFQLPHEVTEDDEFEDFTDFKANFPSCEELKTNDSCEPSVSSDVLAEEPAKLTRELSQVSQENSDDEFANFADFSSSESTFVSAQSRSTEITPHIPVKVSDDTELRTDSEFQDWVSVFPDSAIQVEESSEGSALSLLKAGDSIWSKLQTLETTPALSFQWTDSLANRTMLKALNIDSRNILFMPWSNSGVPRFAANLSSGLLEPVKATEPLQPSVTTRQPTSTNAQETVPDAHFDWGSSGLTNPLDYPKPVLNLPKAPSAEAETILRSLRNLTFMRKNYLVFPMNDT